MDTQEIIDLYILPIVLPEECRRLGIPPEFIKGVYSCYPKPFDFDARCEPILDNGHIIGVKIRIGINHETPERVKYAFRHETWHAKDYYEGKNSSEINAVLYTLFRSLQDKVRH